MEPADYAWRSAADLAELLRQRVISPVELVDAVLDRIEKRNPSLNAVVHLGVDDAKAAARAAERDLRSGETTGPLTGVPVLMKDLFDFKPGWPSTMGGVPALAANSVNDRCVFVERMEAAGAIVVGKTNSPALGARAVTDNRLFGPTSTPFDTTRNAGGSSGGSAAAVADGLVPLAEGTDAGGSIRIPAAWTGTYGLKPSAGRVPTVARPLGFLNSAPFVTEGPITRTVADAALAMTVLAGPDPRAPHGLDGSVDFLAALDRPVTGMRVGYSPDLGTFPVDPAVAAVVAEAVESLADTGVEVMPVEVVLPVDRLELAALWHRTMAQLYLAGLEALRDNGGPDLLAAPHVHFPRALAAQLDEAAVQSAARLRQDDVLRTEIYDRLLVAWAGIDVLATPTVGSLPVCNASTGDTVGPGELAGRAVDPLIGWTLTFPFNFTGNPAASVPAGLAGGLPVGMQLVGRQFRDDDVISLSAAYERVRPWADSYAVCEARLNG
ncbi:amidase [Pseudonocardia sp. GCM10023141]|uniref:amidase n=1 Tax=Pseudonocardia sp. GCM10023141 TaxID=3252653 RepID=UPI0036072DE8